MDTPAVEVVDLVKRYGATTAVTGLTFTARRGAVTALLGPNGAGKTSTIEICEGFRHADGGKVRVLGLDPVSDATAPRCSDRVRSAAATTCGSWVDSTIATPSLAIVRMRSSSRSADAESSSAVGSWGVTTAR
jgi:ABC-type uncharacterized transport system ATPase subunit